MRARLLTLGCLALSLYAACSGDAEGGDDTSPGGSTSAPSGSSGNAGSESLSGSGGGGGSSANGAGGSASGATYTAAQACRLFAQVTCDKGVECGLVLDEVANNLICVQCNALALGIIEQACTQDSPGDKDTGAVDRCIASISAQPCARACSELSADGCEVFGELTGDPEPVRCDPRCAE